MNTDGWELADPTDERAIFQLMVGQDAENPSETALQTSVILDGPNPIPRGKRALELGAGVGRLVRAIGLTGRFEEVVGVDSSISMTLASERYLNGCGGRVILTDGLHIPFPDNHFDFVWSFTVFQHLVALAIIHRNLMEIRRVLIPNGLCRIQTIASGDQDPHNTELFDGRVFRSGEEFADRFRAVGLEVVMVEQGLTHPQHIFVTARKAA